jgi:hypothetical protein
VNRLKESKRAIDFRKAKKNCINLWLGGKNAAKFFENHLSVCACEDLLSFVFNEAANLANHCFGFCKFKINTHSTSKFSLSAQNQRLI